PPQAVGERRASQRRLGGALASACERALAKEVLDLAVDLTSARHEVMSKRDDDVIAHRGKLGLPDGDAAVVRPLVRRGEESARGGHEVARSDGGMKRPT